jgi:hypothetical protein
MPQSFTKDPNAVLDYQIDWSTWLGTDTISSATWTVATGLTKTTDSKTTTTTTVWLSGGTAGTTYSVACRIVTAGGRTDDRTVQIKVEDK